MKLAVGADLRPARGAAATGSRSGSAPTGPGRTTRSTCSPTPSTSRSGRSTSPATPPPAPAAETLAIATGARAPLLGATPLGAGQPGRLPARPHRRSRARPRLAGGRPRLRRLGLGRRHDDRRRPGPDARRRRRGRRARSLERARERAGDSGSEPADGGRGARERGPRRRRRRRPRRSRRAPRWPSSTGPATTTGRCRRASSSRGRASRPAPCARSRRRPGSRCELGDELSPGQLPRPQGPPEARPLLGDAPARRPVRDRTTRSTSSLAAAEAGGRAARLRARPQAARRAAARRRELSAAATF